MKPQTVKAAGKKQAQPPEKGVTGIPLGALAGGTYRGQERRTFRKQIMVCAVEEDGTPCETFECDALDVSKSGIGFRSQKMIATGRAVVVVATTAAGNPHAFYGVVRHSSYGEGARYHTGVEFRAMPESLPLRAWLKQRGLA